MKKELSAIIIASFALAIFSGCLNSPPNPNNLRLVIESNTAPDCIKLSDGTTMLTSCEMCTDFHETPILRIKNECKELFVSIGTDDLNKDYLMEMYAYGIAWDMDITRPGETARFYLHSPDSRNIYLMQKINPQDINPSIFEIRYRTETKPK
jgi:hypothetical protein